LLHSFTGRFAAFVIVSSALLFGAAGAHAAPEDASTSKRAKSAVPAVKVLNASQNAVTGKGVQVRVSLNGPGVVRLKLEVKTFENGTRSLAPSRTIRFGRAGGKTVTVRASATQRQAAEGCMARTVIAAARTGKRSARATADMRRQRAACRLAPVDLSRATACDFIAQPKEGMCLMPFPNDYYTVKDPSRNTGKRISFSAAGMPRNVSSKPIDPTTYSESDGFSQGQGIVLKVPGIGTAEDVTANDFVPLSTLSRYTEPNQKAVVIDVKTGKRWPIWVEIDANSSTPESAALLISPSVNFNERGRYIVALRNLVDAEGNELEAPNAFRYYRDSIPSSESRINQRRKHFEGIFGTLRKAKIKRSELYLAWDFTVASNENNYRRAIHMRDEAFASLGDTTMADNIRQGDAPAFTVSNVTDINGSQTKRRVRGTYTVPCFLEPNCGPGGTMNLDGNGLPQRNGDYQAKFTCIIPQVGLTGVDPPKLRPFVFGHGLLGAADQVQGSINPDLAQDHSMIACATDEIGMASEDVSEVVLALGDLSRFKVVPDRLQQGLLTGLFLARLMYHPDGLGTHRAFQDGDGENTDGESVIRNDNVYYMGASQGGIMGGALTAISPDFIQSALVVGAMNYSTLLTRSSNWPTYGTFLGNAYTNELSHPLLLNMIQMLWDRGEPNGYAHVMTDNPPPNTPEHNVILHVALGDHQVTNFASDVQARTVGMKTPAGGIDPVRWPDYEAMWNIPRIGGDEYPYRGSSIVYWDGGPYRLNPNNLSQEIGTGVPPYANIPPNDDWEDPHGAPRGASGPVTMIDTFFQPDGYIEDICGGDPCRSDDWDGDFSAVIPVP
jgi:hypothetical protein